LVFNKIEQEWIVWVGQQAYETFIGMNIEICINNHYLDAFLEKEHYGWIVTLENDVTFTLRLVEEYKIRILPMDMYLPF
jgi:hypothetical protein